MASAKMICSECGVEMNHHADKLVLPVTPEESARMDPELGGLIEETHTCPGCGKGEARRV
jgi:ribosomal protein S27AE